MSSQPAKEWDQMDPKTQQQIKDRVLAACDTDKDVAAYVLRQRLANASRPALADALDRLH